MEKYEETVKVYESLTERTGISSLNLNQIEEYKKALIAKNNALKASLKQDRIISSLESLAGCIACGGSVGALYATANKGALNISDLLYTGVMVALGGAFHYLAGSQGNKNNKTEEEINNITNQTLLLTEEIISKTK